MINQVVAQSDNSHPDADGQDLSGSLAQIDVKGSLHIVSARITEKPTGMRDS